MKSISSGIFIVILFFLFGIRQHILAQPTPGDSNLNAAGGNPVGHGGGAPVGSGLLILIGLGGAYAGKKYYEMK